MIPERKDLKKLNKLDRIDYILQKNEIENRWKYTPSMPSTIVWFFQGLLVLILLWISAFGINALHKLDLLFKIIPYILYLFAMMLLIEIILFFLKMFERKKEIEKLNGEKFKQ